MLILENFETNVFDFIMTLKDIESIQVISPFIDEDSVILAIEQTTNIQIITDLNYYQIQPNVLELLLDNNISTKLYEENYRLHGKLILITTDTEAYAIVGSSNFTNNGLKHNIEFNVIYKQEVFKKKIQEVQDIFQNIWNGKKGHVEFLTEETLETYRSIWEKANRHKMTVKHYQDVHEYPKEEELELNLNRPKRKEILTLINQYKTSTCYNYESHRQTKANASYLIRNR